MSGVRPRSDSYSSFRCCSTITFCYLVFILGYCSSLPGFVVAHDLQLERLPPRLVDMDRISGDRDGSFRYDASIHRGFPQYTALFDLSETEPLSAVEMLRWHSMRFTPLDRPWRSQRGQPGPMKVVERYNSVDLLGGISRIGEYYTKILVGGQPVRVQVDTGSSTLALPVAECHDCLPSDLRYNMKRSHNKNARMVSCTNKLCAPDRCSLHHCKHCSAVDACCSTENPAGCGFFLKYGDGSFARGALMIDDLTWESRGARNLSAPVVFGGILKDDSSFERSLVDGIMGFAYQSLACNPTCVEPPFQQMVKAGVVDDIFTICLTPRGGKLTLGNVDLKMIKGEISYVPLALSEVPTYYTVNVSSSIKIGDGELPLPNFRHGVIDSGTTLIAVSKVTFLLISEYVRGHYCHIPHMCGPLSWFLPSACVRMSDDVLKKLPTFVFRLGPKGEFDLTLRPEDYMVESFTHGQSVRCVGIMALPKLSPGTDIIFGNTIMRYVTIYDRKRKRMGFGISTGSCGTPPDCSSYTKCDECASEKACAYNFATKTCFSRSKAGYRFFSFPVCSAEACACGLGQQAFFVYGLATGFSSIVFVVGVFGLLICLCGALGLGKRRNPVSTPYELGDPDDADGLAAEPLPLVSDSDKL